MHCAGALSTKKSSVAALEEVLERLGTAPGDGTRDIALVFASMDHAESLGTIARELTARAGCRHVIGCTAESVAGEDREVEGSPALSVWTARIPGATVTPTIVDRNNLKSPEFQAATPRTLILLADPFSFPADTWFKDLAAAKSGLRVMGGMASGSHTPGENRLVLDGETILDGAVGIFLDGDVAIRSVVSQGCRPIGRPLIVTKAERNLIRELGGRPAIEVLREIYDELPGEDQERVQSGLHIGRVISEYQESFGRGDFLVRNVMGVDNSGAIAISDLIRAGRTVQFHVRDAGTADEDLRAMLASERDAGHRPEGALLFSCNGRGTRLFSDPDHDLATIRETFGPIPVAGFFAMGEFGPVGGENFIHGFTASVVLFSAPA